MAALHQLIAGAFRTINLYFSLVLYLALFNLPRAINTITMYLNFLHTKRPLKQHSHPTPDSYPETWSRPSPSADSECAVCLSLLGDIVEEAARGVRQLRCGHAFHGNCLETWLTLGSSTCPLCRLPISPAPSFYGHHLQFDHSFVDGDYLFSFLD